MSFDSREISRYGGCPYRLFLFATADQAWALTNGDTARTYLGRTYLPAAITQPQGPEQDQELQAGSIDIHIPQDHPIANLFKPYLPKTPMSITIFGGHDGDAEVVVIFPPGAVASAAIREDECVLNCVPIQKALQKSIPATNYQPQCNHFLYDPGCGIDPEAHKATGILTSVSDTVLVSAAFTGIADSGLRLGFVEWGEERRMIVDHAGDTLTLITAIPGLAPGATVNAFRGCQGTHAACTFFDNLDNAVFFDTIPTKNVFQTGVN